MDAQQVFYIVATIALGLLCLALVAVIFLAVRFHKFIKASQARVEIVSRNMSESLTAMSKTWGSLTVVGVVVRLISKFIRRRI